MITPEIQDLIEWLKQYMTTDQNADLEKILSIGKKWKEEWEQKEREFREINDRKTFVQQILSYPKKKQKREEENKKILEEIWYHKMNLMEKKKFEEAFIEDLILYIEYPEIEQKEVNEITLDDFKKSWLKDWSTFNLVWTDIWANWAKAIAEMLEKTGWLKAWSTLNLWWNEIWDDWALAIAESIEKTWWLKDWSTLYIRLNKIWDDWKAALQKLKDDAKSKWINCTMKF